MLDDRLLALAQTYPEASRGRLIEIARQREIRNEQEMLELAAIAAEAQVDSLLAEALDTEFAAPDSLLRRAFELTYPNVDIDSLSGRSAKALGGFSNGVKGKYFELLVADKLNAGEAVGGLKLAAGQVARLAESPVTPGWDLEIVAKGGEAVEQLQLKATEQYGPIYRALQENPDVRVIAPGAMRQFGEGVLSADISHAQLEDAAKGYVEELGEGLAEKTVEGVTRFAAQAVPVTTILLVGGTEGAKLLMGRTSLQDAMESGASRIARSAAYNVVAQALLAAGFGPAAIPATMALRVAESRVRERVVLSGALSASSAELAGLLAAGGGAPQPRTGAS